MSNYDWIQSDQFPEPSFDDVDLVEVLRGLADPVRVRIVQRLADGAYHPCRTEEYDLNIHKSTLSHHFKVLRETGLTSTRVRGREHAVQLRQADLDLKFPGLIGAVTQGDTAAKHV